MSALSQYSLLRHLCWGMLGVHDPSRSWVAIMTEYALYLDDGGHPNDQPFLVVAGYVACEERWLAFEPEWRKALARFDLGDVFHMTDFMSCRYTPLKRDHILGSLAAVVKAHTIRPFACAIDIAAYKRVNEDMALEECHGAPFALVVRSVARDIHLWKRTITAEDRLLTFVEEGTKHFGEMEKVMKRDGIPVPNRVPKALPQVQPADILAWEMFHWLKTGLPKMGKNLDRLTRPIRKQQNFGGMVYENDLRRICADTKVPPRSVLSPGYKIAFHSERKKRRHRTIK